MKTAALSTGKHLNHELGRAIAEMRAREVFKQKVLLAMRIVNRTLLERPFTVDQIWLSMNTILKNWEGRQ